MTTSSSHRTDSLAWQEKGICRQVDPDMFFPDKGGSTRDAKRLCTTVCPVREACLQYALDNNERFGIWGGMSTNQRDQLLRRRQEGIRRVADAERDKHADETARKREELRVLAEQLAKKTAQREHRDTQRPVNASDRRTASPANAESSLRA